MYYVILHRSGNLEAWLKDVPEANDYNLYLYDESANLKGYSGELGCADEHIPGQMLPAGKYYLGVKRVKGTSAEESYRLRAHF